MLKFKIIIALFSFFSFFILKTNAQDKSQVFTLLSYNVENLFDTINTPGKRDGEFTPEGSKHWNSERYNTKINHLAKVIQSINTNELPEIIGLYEVENKAVVNDLLAKVGGNGYYGIVHKESPDIRGIDVAMGYRKDEFKVLSKDFIRVIYNFAPDVKTRDILYVKGIASQTDTLHIFLNHWSSRRGGQEKSERKRVQTAKIVRSKVDSIQAVNKNAKIIIMGDFNDEPTNYSISYFLQANDKRLNAKNFELYNLMFDKSNLENKGTFSYRGTWNMLDNLIVSQSLLNKNKGYYTTFEAGKIFRADWMLYYNNRIDEKTPSRTYGGKNYYGGYSDHLPVYFQLMKVNE
ncbi:MAG: hypothetical protein GXO79_01200 [Chlorobi bacterium]|nr:hypothetical protein [Chlorobiota bacterium]